MRMIRFSRFLLINSFLISALSLTGLFGIKEPVAAEPDAGKVPAVPFKYALGVKKFQDKCGVCHGQWLEGSKQGPPLLHPFYKPSHHRDSSFYRAVRKGVRAHHWEFGNMPPVSGLTSKDLDAIIVFIRWYQKEKGLFK